MAGKEIEFEWDEAKNQNQFGEAQSFVSDRRRNFRERAIGAHR